MAADDEVMREVVGLLKTVSKTMRHAQPLLLVLIDVIDRHTKQKFISEAEEWKGTMLKVIQKEAEALVCYTANDLFSLSAYVFAELWLCELSTRE